MVFSSHIFLYYFLPLALGGYFLCPRRIRHAFLTLASYAFYGWANPLFVVLMFVSTLIDYGCGLALVSRRATGLARRVDSLEPGGRRSRTQKLTVVASVVSNLSLLGFFKYFNFFVANYDALAQSLGLPGVGGDVIRVTLPLGISFYTFQSMSYTIDLYRGHARVLRHFIDFACFVSLFPQLVAGPIIRFSDIEDQLRSRTHTFEKFARGMAFLALGSAKKILLANPCGKIADTAFNAPGLDPLDAWYGVSAYAMQIYFDFSAYSDMAIGMGLMFGFMFAKNFDSPYLSASITEFWRRWHLSLSSWLRDYLYIPLGGNRKGPLRTYFNLAAVMLLGGLWHGAAWTFVAWGAIHGGMLILERLMGKSPLYAALPRTLKIALTFVIVLFSWVFFRADDLPAAVAYCGAMLGLSPVNPAAGLIGGLIYQPYYLGTFALAMGVAFLSPQTWDFTRTLTTRRILWCIVVFWLSLAVLATQEFNPFIYFIF